VKSFIIVFKYIAPYKKYAILNIVLSAISTVFSLFSLTLIIPFVGILFNPEALTLTPVPFSLSFDDFMHNFNYFLSKIMITHGQAYALGFISLSVVVFSLLKNVFGFAGSYFMAPIMNGTVRDFQHHIYKKILHLPIRYFSNERKGDILSRFTSDVQEIKFTITGSLDMVFKDPITILVYLAYLVYTSPELTLFVFVVLPLIGLIIGKIGKSLKRKSHEGQAKMGELLSMLEETLSGLRVIKAFNAEKKVDDRFGQLNQKIYKIMNHLTRKNSLSSPLSEFLGTVVVVILLVIGGILTINNQQSLSSSEFIAYLVVFSQIINPAKSLSKSYYSIQKGLASIERVNKILHETMHTPEKPDAIVKNDFTTSIELKNVSFKYNETYVLRNINLEIKKGQTVALVGQSGSGKSTLVDLLPRFYDIEEGEILVDGINIKDYSLVSLRSLIGYVNQEPILFNDTIGNNITFGTDNFTPDAIENAAKVANAHEFIKEKEMKYDSNIGDRGSKLSGGQKQRLSIARAVLKNPPIMILDEATSALDTESERLVQDALMHLMKNRTSVVIAHRLSTIKAADIICVLSEGRIVEQGNHEQLIELNGVYKKLTDLQMF